MIGCLVVGGLAADLLKAEGEGRPEPEARAHAAGPATPSDSPPHTGSRRRVRQARPRPAPPRDGRPHLAEAWGLRRDGGNPCRFVQKYKEQKRERFLSDDEFRRLGRVLAETLAGVTAERGTNAALGIYGSLFSTRCGGFITY